MCIYYFALKASPRKLITLPCLPAAGPLLLSWPSTWLTSPLSNQIPSCLGQTSSSTLGSLANVNLSHLLGAYGTPPGLLRHLRVGQAHDFLQGESLAHPMTGVRPEAPAHRRRTRRRSNWCSSPAQSARTPLLPRCPCRPDSSRCSPLIPVYYARHVQHGSIRPTVKPGKRPIFPLSHGLSPLEVMEFNPLVPLTSWGTDAEGAIRPGHRL